MRKATLVLWLLLISANASLAQHAPPSENLIGVFMSQVRPAESDIRVKFGTLVYQALE